MDIGQEINRHLEWIDTVVSLLGEGDMAASGVDEISRHDRCALGQWLESDESGVFGDLPEFIELKESHEAFHSLAGELIAALEAGDEARALQLQETFIGTSQAVIGYLRLLQQKQGER